MKKLATACCAVLLVLAVMGCPAAQPATVKIGAIFSITGGAAFLGAPEEKTARMFFDDLNAKGGINGIQVELIVMDDKGDANVAVSHARTLIEEKKVFAIIGPTTSGSSLKVREVCEQNKVLNISCAAAEEIVAGAKWVFKTPQKDSQAAQVLLASMKKQGITKIAVIFEGNSFGQEGSKQLAKYAPENGISVLQASEYKTNATDVTDVLSKIKGTEAQAVVNWGVFPAQSIVAQNMKQIGLALPLFQSHGFGNIKYVETAGEAAEGTMFPCGRLLAAESLPDTNKQKKVLVEYKTGYEKKFGEAVSTFGGHAYDACIILVEAIKRSGVDKEKVRTTIEGLTGFPGTAGIFNFTATDHTGLALDALVMYKVKGGKFTLLE